MYRVNSISKNLITLQVVQDGKYKSVQLLPRNFVLSERKTPQMVNLELSKAVRIRVLPDSKIRKDVASETATEAAKVNGGTSTTGGSKVDALSESTVKVAKTMNKDK